MLGLGRRKCACSAPSSVGLQPRGRPDACHLKKSAAPRKSLQKRGPILAFGYCTPIAALAVPSSVMHVASSPASAASCAFLSAVIVSAWPPAAVFRSPTREVSVTSPLGIVALLSAVVVSELVVVVLDPPLSAVASVFCGCCTPGSVAPMVALAPVLSAVVVLLPSVSSCAGAGGGVGFRRRLLHAWIGRADGGVGAAVALGYLVAGRAGGRAGVNQQWGSAAARPDRSRRL